MLPKFLKDLDPALFLTDNYLVLDFEVDTSHGDYGSPIHDANKLLLACWKMAGSATQAHWGGEFEQARLLAAIERADFVVAHAAKYELGWLKRMGVDLRKVFAFDTMIAEYVLLGNLAAGAKELGMVPLSISLDMCCRRRGLPVKDPAVDKMIHNGINPARIPREWLEGRCRQDVETTERVFLDQRGDLQRRGLLPVQYTRCLLTPVLADIQFEGLMLDEELVRKTHEEFKTQLVDLQTQMDKLTGGINMRSALQVAEHVYGSLGFRELTDKRGNPKRTPENKRKVDSKTLDRLFAHNAAQREFLAKRRELSKVAHALSKNLDFFLGVCEEYGSKFHAEIHQTTTATNRLSSTGIPLVFESIKTEDGKPTTKSVQFQNTPRGFKRLFKAKRPGFLMAEPDGSGLEFRTAVYLGDDERGRSDIEDRSFDPHRFTASVLHSTSIEAVKANEVDSSNRNVDSWRQLAKPDTFKPLYGGSKGTPEQERYYKAFRERYPGIAAAQESWVKQALLEKRVVTPWGLTYYFPTAKLSDSGYCNVTATVYNYPIQALATAEIIPIALVYLWHGIHEAGLDDDVYIVNTVHDSAVCEIRPEAVDRFTTLAKKCFTLDVYNFLDRVYSIDFNVPLGVGLKIGSHWGQGKEQSFNVYRDGREEQVK